MDCQEFFLSDPFAFNLDVPNKANLRSKRTRITHLDETDNDLL